MRFHQAATESQNDAWRFIAQEPLTEWNDSDWKVYAWCKENLGEGGVCYSASVHFTVYNPKQAWVVGLNGDVLIRSTDHALAFKIRWC